MTANNTTTKAFSTSTYSSAKDSSGFWINLAWSGTTDATTGTSSITASSTLRNNNSGMFLDVDITSYLSGTITFVASHTRRLSMSGNSVALDSATKTATHNPAGAYSLYVTAYADGNYSYTPQALTFKAPANGSGVFIGNYALPTIANITFDGNGGTTPSVIYGFSDQIAAIPTSTRTGYNFNGWYTAASGGSLVTAGGVEYTLPSSGKQTVYAQWSQSTPVFSDSTISFATVQPRLNVPISSSNDLSVTASPVDSFSIIGGPSWLTGTKSGDTYTISGTPTTQGSFTFLIRASNAGNIADTSQFTITVKPTGKIGTSPIQTAKRFIGIGNTTTDATGATVSADAQGYVPLSRMKKFNGSIWVNISN